MTRAHYGNLANELSIQWRIQDFPDGGAPTPKLGLFSNFFAENCMKIKEFLPPGGRPFRPPLDPPMVLQYCGVGPMNLTT